MKRTRGPAAAVSALSIAALAYSAAASAQVAGAAPAASAAGTRAEPGKDVMLAPVSVRGRTDATTEGTRTYATEATSTATGLTLSPRDTPQSVSVVTRERIDDQAMTNVGDALRNTTGVSLKPVDRGRNNLSVRGFDVNNFQFDGVPMATGNIGLETLNTAMFDRIEVVRGATGLLSGAGDPSAAVNLVRKHADSKVFTGSLIGELGSWNQRTATFDLSMPLSRDGSVRGRIVGSAGAQNAFIDLERTKNTLLYGIVDADLTPNTRLSIGASDQRDERSGVLWAGLPYWYSDGTRTDWNRSKTTAVKWNQWDTTEQTAFATLEHRFANRWRIRADATFRRQDENSKLLWMWGDPDRTTGLGPIGQPYHYISDPQQRHFGLSVTGPFQLLGREQELHVGAMHSRLRDGWQNRDLIDDDGDGVVMLPDFNNWDGSFPEPPMTPHYVASRGTTTQSGVYAVTRLQFTDRVKTILGGRLSNWKRDEEAAVWTPSAYTVKHSSEFTPYAGLIVDLSERVSAYASYSDIFKPQTNKDAQGKFLDPLRGKSYEAGLKTELLDGKLNASAAVFQVDQENYAVQIGFDPDTAEPIYRAAQGVKSKGYELEVSGEVAPGWDVNVGWTHYKAKDADGADVAVDHARKQLKLFTRYRLQGAWHGLSVGGGVNWEGDRPITAVNPVTGETEKVGQPAYALVDLMAKYEFNPQFALQLTVFNALDKKYRSGSHWWGAPYTYGEPRKVLLTGTYKF
jgi:outer membrane receptor for ferric coprogen and ferric-rhodotorulic acid